MREPATDREYLRYQYGDAEKLHVRIDTHQRFSESPDRLVESLLAHLALSSGLGVPDIGCMRGVRPIAECSRKARNAISYARTATAIARSGGGTNTTRE